MKRVFEHPPESPTGKRYWRSLGELSDTPEFRGWLEREFPAGAAQMEGDEWSRRSFLKLMGASMALAGFGLTVVAGPKRIWFRSRRASEWAIPGQALYYATAMPRRTGAMPLVVTTVDGRPIKIEGNPLHPGERRRDRRLRPGFGSRSLRSVALEAFRATKDKTSRSRRLSKNISPNCGRRLRPMAAPAWPFWSRKRIRRRASVCASELQKQFPANALVRLRSAPQRGAKFRDPDQFRREHRARSAASIAPMSFSRSTAISSIAAKAISLRFALSLRGDGCGEAKDTMNRLYVVENRFTLTGAMADHRLRCPASQIPAFTHALARKIAARPKTPGLSSVLDDAERRR